MTSRILMQVPWLFNSWNPKWRNTRDRDFTIQASRPFTLRASGCQNVEIPKYPSVRSTNHNYPWDRWFWSNRDFTVWDSKRQEYLSFQLMVPEIPKWINCPDLLVINGHYSLDLGVKKSLIANPLIAPPDPMACEVSMFLLENSPPSIQVSEISPPRSTQC